MIHETSRDQTSQTTARLLEINVKEIAQLVPTALVILVVNMYGNLNLSFGHLLVHQSFYAPVDPTILCVVSSGKKCLAD